VIAASDTASILGLNADIAMLANVILQDQRSTILAVDNMNGTQLVSALRTSTLANLLRFSKRSLIAWHTRIKQ
jgi:hypothetical protein